MGFIKVNEANFIRDEYHLGDPVIINTSHISSVDLCYDEIDVTESSKKEIESFFDMDISKLCILRIRLIDKRSYTIFAPYEKFENFNKK